MRGSRVLWLRRSWVWVVFCSPRAPWIIYDLNWLFCRDREMAKFEAYLNKEECFNISAIVKPRTRLAYPMKKWVAPAPKIQAGLCPTGLCCSWVLSARPAGALGSPSCRRWRPCPVSLTGVKQLVTAVYMRHHCDKASLRNPHLWPLSLGLEGQSPCTLRPGALHVAG